MIMRPFTYYAVRCKLCGARMRIGDTRTADEIRRMLESGETVSGHAAECEAGWGRTPMAFEVTAETETRDDATP